MTPKIYDKANACPLSGRGGLMPCWTPNAIDKILVIDDELIIRKSFEETLRGRRYSVSSAASLAEAERLLQRDQFDVIFVDLRLPDGQGTELLGRFSCVPVRPFIVVMSGSATIESTLACIREGAFDYLLKPFAFGQVELVIKKAEAYRQMTQMNRYLASEVSDTSDLTGESQSLTNLKLLLKKVAPTEATVLIQGENGTGKELVAREIFKASARSGGPYIKINCAAVSEALMESEFFGHEKGSFTGATERREGRFELANGGTILLDEISEISPRLQAKLLRVLQEREFERVGGNKTIKVDVRILATTNRDLKSAVAKGEFREDLYYRLNVFPIHVPPLRRRASDIPIIANHFLQKMARKHGSKVSTISEEAMEMLKAHQWPGNVRELQNTIERAVILSHNNVTEIPASALGLLSLDAVYPSGSENDGEHQEMPGLNGESSGTPMAKKVNGNGQVQTLAEMERGYIFNALERTGGNRTKAAQVLGISIRTLRNKLNLYKLETV